MVKVQDLYDTNVRSMPPAERLKLARLILNDLSPPEAAVDTSDDWSDDDLADFTAFSARHALRPPDDHASTAQ